MRVEAAGEVLVVEFELVLALPESVPIFGVLIGLEPNLVISVELEPGTLVPGYSFLSSTMGASIHHWITPVTEDRTAGGLEGGGCSNGSREGTKSTCWVTQKSSEFDSTHCSTSWSILIGGWRLDMSNEGSSSPTVGGGGRGGEGKVEGKGGGEEGRGGVLSH